MLIQEEVITHEMKIIDERKCSEKLQTVFAVVRATEALGNRCAEEIYVVICECAQAMGIVP